MYPQYRRLSNGKSYYEILSADEMREITVSGKRWTEYEIKAKILPERVLITDLLDMRYAHYELISEKEFFDFLDHCRTKLFQF
ncbi:MAG: hypothetical protein RLZZ262_2279 [Bacteroidota bacterium]|jgi:hypothetical protein